MSSFRKHISILVIAVASLSGNLNAQDDQELDAQSLQMLKKNRDRNAEDIANINKRLESNGTELQVNLSTLSLIEKKINSRKSTLNYIDKSINVLQKQLKEKKQAVEQLQNDLESVKRSYKNLLNKYYNIRFNGNTWMMLMASESFAQAYKRMEYVREILLLLDAQTIKIKDMTERLNDEIANIYKKEQLLSSDISEKQKEMELLRMEEKQSKTVYSELRRNEKTLKKQLQEREESYNEIGSQMREFMKAEIKNKQETGITDEMILSAKSLEELKGFLPQPAIGMIVWSFNENKTKSAYSQIALNPNRGIDIQTANNAEVYSISNGVVMRSEIMRGAYSVLIRHGAYYSLYSSLGTSSVKVGDNVKARQKIGTVKKSSDGSILHFELWKDREPINPEEWILN
ncbi:MAG: peptidoglycan DD-metalloendopeptidase family protein [Prevotellaceae bacterium]|jgi:septal ring factor EnvC (AmiA/AmiB activator)|nr:peptidoglycan DD-metalloendopeptidase family protein [Prevotellaceae bacterium]